MYLKTKKTKEWKQINFRNIDSMLSVQFIYDLYDQYNNTLNWFRFKNVCLYYQDDKLWSFTPQEDWDNVLENISKQFINPSKYSNPDIIKNCFWYSEKKESLLLEFLEKSNKINLNILTNKELYDLLFNWYQITLNQIYFINLAPVENGLQKAISDLNPNKYLNSEEISILYSLDENTAVIKEELAFLKAIIKVDDKDDKCITKIINRHLKEFSHVTLGYGSKPLDEKVLMNRYYDYLKNGIKSTKKYIQNIESYSDKIKQKKQNIIKKIDNYQLVELFNLAAKLGLMRDRKKALLGKSVEYRNKILEHIENISEAKKEHLKYYIMEDLYELLINKKVLNYEEVENRKQGVYISSVTSMNIGCSAREDYYTSIKFEKEDINILKKRIGVCASSGKVIGRAKICLSFEESNELKDGEILITYGTDFDFMNGIMKAKGIVTEEGGILSHASVISRELNKPCIIAYKGITKILKNGDLIEIDADNGKINFLEENKSNFENKKIKTTGIYFINENIIPTEVGNKAYNLSKLFNLQYNVPEAYILGKTFFEILLKEQKLYEKYIKYASNLDKYKDDIFELIDNIKIPINKIERLLNFDKYTYAVRSSSTTEDGNNKSFAGQYKTELFCNTIEFTIKSIKESWKSLLGVGLDEYKDENMNDIFGGIIIQQMIDADYSGVLFTKNPVDNNKDFMIIECCNGVASKLVDNKVIPERYYINQKNLKIIGTINNKNISEKNLIFLSKIGQELEKYYGCEVDIEWACKKDILYIIQCRPITT